MKMLPLVIVGWLILVGCKTTQQLYLDQGYREVNGPELAKMYSGKRAVSGNWQQSYYENGKVRGIGGGVSYDGSWRVNDEGRICTSSSHQQANVCESVFVSPDGKIIMESTTGTFHVDLIPIE